MSHVAGRPLRVELIGSHLCSAISHLHTLHPKKTKTIRKKKKTPQVPVPQKTPVKAKKVTRKRPKRKTTTKQKKKHGGTAKQKRK